MAKTILGAALLLLCGCFNSSYLYRKDVAQGNVYSSEDLRRIQPGLEREAVQRILGTPQLNDPFRPQQDIYLYRHYSGDSRQSYQARLVISYDQQNRVVNVDNRPTTVIKD